MGTKVKPQANRKASMKEDKKSLAVFELKFYYIDDAGNTDGKHYTYKGDHSSFCDGIDKDMLEEVTYT